MLKETREALVKSLAFIEKMEWSAMERCPSCGGLSPNNNRPAEWHGRFGHSDDCELAQILGRKPRRFTCDCYVKGATKCVGRPTYSGKLWKTLAEKEQSDLIWGS